jgi:hypothetical protein
MALPSRRAFYTELAGSTWLDLPLVSFGPVRRRRRGARKPLAPARHGALNRKTGVPGPFRSWNYCGGEIAALKADMMRAFMDLDLDTYWKLDRELRWLLTQGKSEKH